MRHTWIHRQGNLVAALDDTIIYNQQNHAALQSPTRGAITIYLVAIEVLNSSRFSSCSMSTWAVLQTDTQILNHSACTTRVALARLLSKKYKSIELLFIPYRLLEFLAGIFKDKEALKPLQKQISDLHTREERKNHILLRGLKI
jgi:hypothetical protein